MDVPKSRKQTLMREGAKSGHYVFGEDLLVTDENGNSYISYADYAKAMVELVLENQPQRSVYQLEAKL